MTEILLFTGVSCISCESTERELKCLADSRSEVRLVVFHRAEDFEKFREYNIAICPAVFMEDTFISYGMPDMRKLKSITGNGKGNRNRTKQLKTNLRGELK